MCRTRGLERGQGWGEERVWGDPVASHPPEKPFPVLGLEAGGGRGVIWAQGGAVIQETQVGGNPKPAPTLSAPAPPFTAGGPHHARAGDPPGRPEKGRRESGERPAP